MGSLHKKIQLMLDFLKAPFLVLHFCYYILMTFLMMLSVIFLSKLMILLFPLNVILHIWSVATTRIGFWTWIYLQDSLDWGRKWLVDFNYCYYYYFYSYARNRFYWVTFKLEDICWPKFCTITFFISHLHRLWKQWMST